MRGGDESQAQRREAQQRRGTQQRGACRLLARRRPYEPCTQGEFHAGLELIEPLRVLAQHGARMHAREPSLEYR